MNVHFNLLSKTNIAVFLCESTLSCILVCQPAQLACGNLEFRQTQLGKHCSLVMNFRLHAIRHSGTIQNYQSYLKLCFKILAYSHLFGPEKLRGYFRNEIKVTNGIKCEEYIIKQSFIALRSLFRVVTPNSVLVP